jgi:DNA polymerase II small subunit
VRTFLVSAASATLSVSKAVNYALSHGYQVAPDALKLLQDAARAQQQYHQKQMRKEVALESVVALIIEEKARASIGQIGKDLANTIRASDLVEVEPELFEAIHSRTTITTPLLPPSSPPVSSTTMSSQSIVTTTTVVTAEAGPLETVESKIEIVSDPSDKIQPVGIDGFSQLFKSRYEKLMRILRERPESRQLSRISELKGDKGGRIGGLVYSKRAMKNGVEIVVDDESGKLSALALSDQAKKMANEVALDQCVMMEIDGKGGRFIVKSITQPDLPNRIASGSKKTVYAAFLSDLHVGSDKFLEGAFARFLEWLSGRGLRAKEDEEIIRRLKYVIIGGDIVDGVGIFPNQEYELAESNIYKQYEMVASRLSSIPKHLSVFAIPGNHDSTRQALPQPMIPRKYAEALYNLKNVTMLGDPSMIKLNGVSILVYHGRSLDDILATTPGLSYERPAEAMKVLLKARHLAPIFGSRTPIAPEVEDHLVIEQVPDIFHAGHVHSVGIESYRGTLIINSGTWQAQTGYQANLGIMPRPGLVPIVNLATLQISTREFLTTYEPVVVGSKESGD